MTTYTLHGWSQAETFIITLDHKRFIVAGADCDSGKEFSGYCNAEQCSTEGSTSSLYRGMDFCLSKHQRAVRDSKNSYS